MPTLNPSAYANPDPDSEHDPRILDPHPSAAPLPSPPAARIRGRIRQVRETFGFLIDERGVDRFFHRMHTHYSDLTLVDQSAPLSSFLTPGLTVEFLPVVHSKGPRALCVRLLDS